MHRNFGLSLSCRMQPLLSAVYVLEHMVSEIPCQGVVHAVCECAGVALAAVFLLSRRRMAPRHIPARNRILYTRHHLSGRSAGSQPCVAAFRTHRSGLVSFFRQLIARGCHLSLPQIFEPLLLWHTRIHISVLPESPTLRKSYSSPLWN